MASNRLTALDSHLHCPLLQSLNVDSNALAAFPIGIPLLMLSRLQLASNRCTGAPQWSCNPCMLGWDCIYLR